VKSALAASRSQWQVGVVVEQDILAVLELVVVRMARLQVQLVAAVVFQTAVAKVDHKAAAGAMQMIFLQRASVVRISKAVMAEKSRQPHPRRMMEVGVVMVTTVAVGVVVMGNLAVEAQALYIQPIASGLTQEVELTLAAIKVHHQRQSRIQTTLSQLLAGFLRLPTVVADHWLPTGFSATTE